MFSLTAKSLCADLLRTEPWAYLGCASFEPRWEAFALQCERFGVSPASALVLQPTNSSSRWHKECAGKQHENWSTSVIKTRWGAEECNVALPEPLSWTNAVEILRAMKTSAAAETLVVDITTMPRSAFFPILKAAIVGGHFSTVVAVYSEPARYFPGALASEPTTTAMLSGFDHLTTTGTLRPSAAWLPILGFGPQFLSAVYESIVDAFDLGSRIYPILGFPAYNPQFFERALSDGGKPVREILRQQNQHGDRFVYAAATDPFETAAAIHRLIATSGLGLAWLGTPTGPKPMALGMLLCALEDPITVLIAPPRTYNYAYSEGAKRTHAYVLRRSGSPTYRLGSA